MREALLRVNGIERVLIDDGLASWGCDPEAGVLALAVSGASFEARAAVCGRREHAPEDTPVLLGWFEGKRWPSSVHDTRIAATLASLAGAERREGDEPL